MIKSIKRILFLLFLISLFNCDGGIIIGSSCIGDACSYAHDSTVITYECKNSSTPHNLKCSSSSTYYWFYATIIDPSSNLEIHSRTKMTDNYYPDYVRSNGIDFCLERNSNYEIEIDPRYTTSSSYNYSCNVYDENGQSIYYFYDQHRDGDRTFTFTTN